nr:MAG: nonstructural protein [Microvirus sp.]
MMKIFTVFDSKAEAYMQPFFMQSKGAAIRAYADLANDSNHTFGKHPEDYTLFEIGSYDEATAAIVSYSTPISLGVAVEHLRKQC